MRTVSPTPRILLNAKAANGVGNALDVSKLEHIYVAVSATDQASLTFKFQGSVGKSSTSTDVPDFSAAQALTNHWDYVGVIDVQSQSAIIAGDTGVTLNDTTVAVNTRIYQINVDALKWLSMEVSGLVDGAVTAWLVGFNDDAT